MGDADEVGRRGDHRHGGLAAENRRTQVVRLVILGDPRPEADFLESDAVVPDRARLLVAPFDELVD
jgi:hypothetical protein